MGLVGLRIKPPSSTGFEIRDLRSSDVPKYRLKFRLGPTGSGSGLFQLQVEVEVEVHQIIFTVILPNYIAKLWCVRETQGSRKGRKERIDTKREETDKRQKGAHREKENDTEVINKKGFGCGDVNNDQSKSFSEKMREM